MSFFDTLLGNDASNAANSAAADTYQKQVAATQGLQNYGNSLPGQYNQIAQNYTPYANAGGSALNMLYAGLGLGGPNSSQQFTNAYQSLPGYQSALNTGTTAAQRLLNSGGISQSGGALKALQRYGQDYEDQKSGNYLGQLQGLSGMGLQATGAESGLQAQGIGANTGVQQTAYGGQMQSAGTIGQGEVAGAQAKSDALGNLLKTGAYLGGAALGGPAGSALGAGMNKWFSPKPQYSGYA